MSRRKDAKEHLLERPDEEQPLRQPQQDPFKYQYTSETKPVMPTTSPEVSQQSVEGTTASQVHHSSLDDIPSSFPPSSGLIVSVAAELTEPVSPPLELFSQPVPSQPVPSQVDAVESKIDQTVDQATSRSAV